MAEIVELKAFFDGSKNYINYSTPTQDQCIEQLRDWADEDFLAIGSWDGFDAGNRKLIEGVAEFLRTKRIPKFQHGFYANIVDESHYQLYEETIYDAVTDSTVFFMVNAYPTNLYFDKLRSPLLAEKLFLLDIWGIKQVKLSDHFYEAIEGMQALKVLTLENVDDEAELDKFIKWITTTSTSVELLAFEACPNLSADKMKNAVKASIIHGTLRLGIELLESVDGDKKFVNYALKEDMLLFKKQYLSQADMSAEIETTFKGDVKAEFGRSKLMVVGEGRAGKTSTIRSLMKKPFSQDQASTQGVDLTKIDVADWSEGEFNYVAEHLKNALDRDRAKEAQNIIANKATGSKSGAYQTELEKKAALAEKEKKDFNASIGNKTSTNGKDGKSGKTKIQINKEEVKRYGNALLLLRDRKKAIGFTIWDFGGQHVFYSLHHMFLTKFGCYLIVFNSNKLLGAPTREVTLDFLRFWLFSKKLHAPTAPLLIVATHCLGLESETLKEIDDILVEKLLDIATFAEVYNDDLSFFPIDNSTSEGVVKLREKIEEVVAEAEYIKEQVPIAFLRLLDLYSGLKNKYVMKENDEVRERCGLSKEQLNIALKFLNHRGLITYFSEPAEVSNFITLDPQWLIDGITTIVFDPKEHPAPKFSSKYGRKYRKFMETQVITGDLLRDIWKKKGYNAEEQGFFRGVMLKALLMCKYDFNKKESYLVPSLVSPSQFHSREEKKKATPGYEGPFFVIDFSGDYKKEVVLDDGEKFVRFLPYGMLERLICLCISHSATYDESLLPEISTEDASLSFGTHATLNVRLADNQDGDRLWIMFATKTKTSLTKAAYCAQIVYSMIEGIEEDFFSRSGGESQLPISLLVPSTEESGSYLADYETLLEHQQEGMDKEFFPNPKVSKSVQVSDYGNWLGAEHLIISKQKVEEPVVQKQEQEHQQLQPVPTVMPSKVKKLKSGCEYHCFLSYKQTDSIYLVGKQHKILSDLGYKCWYDQQYRGELNLESMLEGVAKSMCYVLFLSKNIFSSAYVGEEVKKAVSLGKKIMFLHHPETNMEGYCSFGHYIATAPANVKPLFKKIESIQLRTRFYEEEAVTRQIDERLQKMTPRK